MEDAESIHERWITRVNRDRDPNDPAYDETWDWDQCGTCRHWVPLEGTLGADWGVCSSAASPFDRMAMFEHDGCEFHESVGREQTGKEQRE